MKQIKVWLIAASVCLGLEGWAIVASGSWLQDGLTASIGDVSAMTSTPPPPPPSSSSRGPQDTILCPAGAVDIYPGKPIASMVNLYQGATTFCLRAGVHAITGPITPKSGNVFVGAYGAILDGAGWSTTQLEQGAFRAHDQDINDVTIRNLVIRNMPQRGIHTWSSGDCSVKPCRFMTTGADRWIVEYNDIHHNSIGVQGSNEMQLRHNLIRYNQGPNACGDHTLARGGGVVNYLTRGMVIENNEISYSGCENKFDSLSLDMTFRNNWVHHNLGNGVWADGGGALALIEGNLVEDNGAIGIFYEVSGPGIIRNNTIRRNGTNAIQVSTSHGVQVYGNTLEENFGGIILYMECERVFASEGGYVDEIFMQDVAVHDNSVWVKNVPGAYANGISWGACSPTQIAPYLQGKHNLTFLRNAYITPNLGGAYWLWSGLKTWAEWQALRHEQ